MAVWRLTVVWVVIGLFFGLMANGADWTVGVSGDFSTIQEAIDAASSGDSVVVEQGTYTETIDFLGKAIVLRSSDPNDPEVVALTVIDGGGVGPVVSFVTGESAGAVLEGLTITGGVSSGSGGGILCQAASPTIRLCAIHGNNAADGAGIYAENSQAVLEHCEIYSNTATSAGGGVACNRSSVVLFDCLIRSNSAVSGGGVWSFRIESVPELRHCTLTGNIVSGDGGGLYSLSGSNPLVINSIFWANTASGSGAEIFNVSGVPVFSFCDVGGSGGSGSWDVLLGVDNGGNIDADPNFVSGVFGNFYLSQIAAGESVDSPAVDVGSGATVSFNLGNRTTRTDEVGDAGTVDMGYHYAPIADNDGDGIRNLQDSCPVISNPAQEDFDGDGIGDVCDDCPEDAVDADSDTVQDSCDNCVSDANLDQADTDGDGVGDVCDNCVDVANADQIDSSGNGIGDACDEPFIVYEVIDLGTLGGASSFAYAINDANQVVGEARVSANDPLHAFLWEDDGNGPVMTDLGLLAPIDGFSAAYDINSSGQAAGIAEFTGFLDWHGGFWNAGSVVDMGTLGIEHSTAEGLNDAGQVVGHFRKISSSRAFVWDNGVMTELGTLSGSTTKAYDINNFGLIVGESRVGSSVAFSAVASDPNNLTSLGTLGGSSVARGVNDFGDIVGFSQVAGINHAFVLPDGFLMEDLGLLTGGKSEAYDINDVGQVVGFAEVANVNHAMLWDPNESQLYKAVDLNDRLPNGSGWSVLTQAWGINTAGNIVGHGDIGGQTHGFFMHPELDPVVWAVPGDFATIQEAINAATDGDRVEIAAGTYSGPGNVDLNFFGKAITVGSSDPSDPNVVASVVIDCAGSLAEEHRAFVFASGETTSSVVEGLTIRFGFVTSGGGAIDCNSVSPTIRNCVIEDCETLADGGAIFCRDSSAVISLCTVRRCVAGGKGGAIALTEQSEIAISSSRLEDNTSETGGGALYCDNSNPVVTSSIFHLNQVTNGDGGGILCENGSDPFLSSCQITFNVASGTGGGVSGLGISSPNMTDCELSNNQSSLAGGGGFSDGGSMQLTDCVVENNQAGGEGGGLAFQGGSAPVIRGTMIRDNISLMQGGGVYGLECSVDLKQCEVVGNQSQSEGAGLSFWGATSLPVVENSLIAGNQTSSDGGGIYCENVIASLSNCTVVGNRAGSGAGICNFLGTTDVVNSIFWSNEPDEICGFGFPDPNVVYSDVGLTVGAIWPGDGNVNGDPNFVAPGFWNANGTVGDLSDDFWVEGDYRLTSGSVVEDAGDPNRSYDGQKDLDELPREFERVDIGAYELRRALQVPSEAYATIQAAIDAAIDGDTVLVADGLYQGSGNRDITFGSSAITVKSVNGSAGCVIDCQGSATEAHRGFLFESQNNTALVVEGFTIINGYSDFGGGIFCHQTSPTLRGFSVRDCVADKSGGGIYFEESNATLINSEFSGNRAALTGGAVQCYRFCDPNIVNCTLTGNRAVLRGGGLYSDWSSEPKLTNSILWANEASQGPELGVASVTFPSQLQVSYSDVAGGQEAVFVDSGSTLIWGAGNVAVNPSFAVEGAWDPNGTADEVADDFWVNGDTHLKSQEGRWDPNSSNWVFDGVNSVAIDRGDLQSDWSSEPAPNGGRINLGVYGGTSQASRSGVCMVGNGDLTVDGMVDIDDLITLTQAWLLVSAGLEDMNCDGVVDWLDFAILASAWLEPV